VHRGKTVDLITNVTSSGTPIALIGGVRSRAIVAAQHIQPQCSAQIWAAEKSRNQSVQGISSKPTNCAADHIGDGKRAIHTPSLNIAGQWSEP
jgi:hypothetical protein